MLKLQFQDIQTDWLITRVDCVQYCSVYVKELPLVLYSCILLWKFVWGCKLWIVSSSHTTNDKILRESSVLKNCFGHTQGSQTRGPPVHFMRPCTDLVLIIECGPPQRWFFYFKMFFCHGPERLKKVCYPWLSTAVILLSGNTKDRASRTRCSVGGNCCQAVEHSQGFPPGGQYTKVVLTRSLFNDNISVKKLLYRRENNVKKPW
jgi:hypothetical protein